MALQTFVESNKGPGRKCRSENSQRWASQVSWNRDHNSADQNIIGREKSQRVYVVLLKAKERLCSSHMGNYEKLKVNVSMKYHIKENKIRNLKRFKRMLTSKSK